MISHNIKLRDNVWKYLTQIKNRKKLYSYNVVIEELILFKIRTMKKEKERMMK